VLGKFRGEKAGVWGGGIQVPGCRAPLCHGPTQPWEGWQGGKRWRWLWSCPAPATGVSWVHAGTVRTPRTPLLPCHQHLRNAVCFGPLQAARRGDAAQPWERGPLHQSPSRGRGSPPVCTGVKRDPSLALLRGCSDPWGKQGILSSFCRSPKCLQDRLGFGTRGEEVLGCGGLRSWDPGAAGHPPPSVHREEGEGTLHPRGDKQPLHPPPAPSHVYEPSFTPQELHFGSRTDPQPLNQPKPAQTLHAGTEVGDRRWSLGFTPLLTCTLDSGRLIFKATSSRMKMSG